MTTSEKNRALNPKFWITASLLSLLCAILYAWRLGATPLLDVDEPRYAEAARQMVLSNNWITPYFNGAVRFDKPPLFYWLAACFYQWLGVSEFSARLPSVLASVATVLAIFWTGYRQVSLRFGLIAGLILATSLEMLTIGRLSITDMTLCAFLTATSLCLMGVAQGKPKAWLWAGFFSGLAMLTKGPVGLVLPGLILLADSFFPTEPCPLERGQGEGYGKFLISQIKTRFVTSYFPLALLLALLIALPWYIACYQQNGQSFINALFLHNVSRYNGVVSGHTQTWWFYPVVLLVGFLPWTAYLPITFSKLFQDVIPAKAGIHLKNKPLVQPSDMENEHVIQMDYRFRGNDILRYSLVWTVVTFGFFAVAQTKLLTYILPMFPACALAVAFVWNTPQTHKTGLQRASVITSGALLLAAGILLTQIGRFMPKIVASLSGVPPGIPWAIAALLLGTLGATLLLWSERWKTAFAMQVAGITLFALAAVGGVLPTISRATQGDLLRFLGKVGSARLVSVEIVRPSLTFYHQQTVTRVGLDEVDQLLPILRQAKDPAVIYVVTKNEWADHLNPLTPYGVRISPVDIGKVYGLFRLQQRLP